MVPDIICFSTGNLDLIKPPPEASYPAANSSKVHSIVTKSRATSSSLVARNISAPFPTTIPTPNSSSLRYHKVDHPLTLVSLSMRGAQVSFPQITYSINFAFMPFATNAMPIEEAYPMPSIYAIRSGSLHMRIRVHMCLYSKSVDT